MKNPMEAFASLRETALQEYGAAFEGCETEAFRFEMLPFYTIASEAPFFAKFKSGETCPDEFNQKWLETLDKATTSGKTFKRVRLMPDKPLPVYLRFEYEWGYKRNVVAGEKIYFLPPTDPATYANDIPMIGDFWLFDRKQCFLMFYDQIGRFLGVRRVADDDLRCYVAFADKLLQAATPFDQFRLE